MQTHFRSFPPERFTEKVLGAISRFMRPKAKLFAVKYRGILDVVHLQGLQKKFWAHGHDFCIQKRSCLPWGSDAFWKFSACKIYRKRFGRNFTIFASKNEAVCLEIQTHFGNSLRARFTEIVLGAFSRFLHPKTKLFALRFRRILEILCVQDLQKKFWAHFHDLCIQKRSCYLWNSDAFQKFSACKIYRKSFGRNFTICVSRKQTFLTSTFCKSALGTFYNFASPQIFAVLLGHIVKFLTFTFCKNTLNLNTFRLRVHPQIVTHKCDFMQSTFKQVLDWHLRHVL